MVAQSPDEIIVVDYGCPDKAGEWVETNFPHVKVVRVNDDPNFCLARARNLGAEVSQSTWLCMIDADVCIKSGWAEWMRRHLHPDYFYRSGEVNGKRDSETSGTAIIPYANWAALGGYDDVIRGWGAEDKEFYERLVRQGLVQAEYPSHYVSALQNSNAERTAFQEIKDRRLQDSINVCYSAAKQCIMKKIEANDLPKGFRQLIMAKIRDALLNLSNKSRIRPLNFRISLPTSDSSRCDVRLNETELSFKRKRRYRLFGPTSWQVTLRQ